MKFFALRLTDLESNDFTAATPDQIAAWMFLHAFCTKQCNGGTIPAARDCTPRLWARHGIDAAQLARPSPLWDWHGADLVLKFYDLKGEEAYRAKSAGGKASAAIRWGKNKATGPAPGMADKTPMETADADNSTIHQSTSHQNTSQYIPCDGSPEGVSAPDGTSPAAEPAVSAVSAEGLDYADWFRSTLPPETRLCDGWRVSFAEAYDELVRLDGRDPGRILAISAWAREDPFWRMNFLSPLKLRRKNREGTCYYDVLAAKVEGPACGVPPPPAGGDHFAGEYEEIRSRRNACTARP